MAADTPPRLPLRRKTSCFVDGIMSDGVVALFPEDPAYERAYRFAVEAWREFGTPMPYASQALIDQTIAQRAETAAAS